MILIGTAKKRCNIIEWVGVGRGPFRQNFHKDLSEEEEPLYLKKYKRSILGRGQQVQRPCGMIKPCGMVTEQKEGLLTRASWWQEMRWEGDGLIGSSGTLEAIEAFEKGMKW